MRLRGRRRAAAPLSMTAASIRRARSSWWLAVILCSFTTPQTGFLCTDSAATKILVSPTRRSGSEEVGARLFSVVSGS